MQIFTLGVACLFLNSCIIAFTIKSVLLYEDDYYTWSGALMLGAVIAAQDPSTIQGALKGTGISKQFHALIENESLVSFSIGTVIFTCGEYLLKTNHPTSSGLFWIFITSTFGGIILGILIGIVTSLILRKLFTEETQVINITIITGYFAFFFAESYLSDTVGIKISGTVTLISLGLFMSGFGNTRINAQFQHSVKDFWEYILYFAKTLIFMFGGLIIGFYVLKENNNYI